MGRRRQMLIIIGLAVLAGAAVLLIAQLRFDAMIDGLRDQVLLAESAADLPELPAIVRDFATRNGGSASGPARIHLRHRAQLTTARGNPPLAIAADQWLATGSSDMVWRGRGAMLGLPVTVVDSIVDGEGLLEARVLGLITVAKGTGADFAKGEIQRYLSELPVHPDAILRNGALRWRQLDPTHVEVTASSAYGEAGVTFEFDHDGDIVGMEAPDRPMTVDGKAVPTVWRGLYGRYETIGTRRIPTRGEVGWVLPEGLFTYWTGDIVAYEPL